MMMHLGSTALLLYPIVGRLVPTAKLFQLLNHEYFLLNKELVYHFLSQIILVIWYGIILCGSHKEALQPITTCRGIIYLIEKSKSLYLHAQ